MDNFYISMVKMKTIHPVADGTAVMLLQIACLSGAFLDLLTVFQLLSNIIHDNCFLEAVVLQKSTGEGSFVLNQSYL